MGIASSVSAASYRRIVKANEILLLVLAILVGSLLSTFFMGFYYSACIYVEAILLLLVSYRLNTIQQFGYSKVLSIVNTNINIVLLNYVEGLDAGNYNYFFPYFLVLTFIVNIEKQKKTLVIYYLQALISCGICFIISPRQSHIQNIPTAAYAFIFSINILLSMTLTLILSYMIIRVNKKNEASILQEKKYFNTIFNTASDSILIVNDATNVIDHCNSTAIQMFGVKQLKDIVNTSIFRWMSPPVKDVLSEGLLPLEATDKIWHDELMLNKADGTNFFAYVHILRFQYKGELYKKINVLDISELKSTEFEMMQAKEKAETATRAKSRFLSSMSHELRTPLNGIIGATNLMLQADYPKEQRKNLDILRYSSEHMLQLINHILDFSKIEAGKIDLAEDPFNLKELLLKITPQFAQQATNKNIRFTAEVDEGLNIDILSDETRLYQVISNLLANAVKFTAEGGVRVVVKKMFASSHIVSVKFMVIDTGIGIPSEKQNDIFRNFTQAHSDITRKYGGTGLGLAICKKLLRMMGTDLQVESELGKGASFHFMMEFKISQERKSYINEDASKDLTLLSGLRVLLAEDNAINRIIAKQFLEKWGVVVTEANNGREAVTLFEKDKFDVVLIDLEMPELDGLAALRKIREVDSHIPAIAFTAAVYDNIQADLIEKGFNDFVHKPFRPEDLHAKISKQLSAALAQAERA
jgi:PAS domain S-box-containing protein